MKKVSSRGIVIKDGYVLLIYREKKCEKYYSIPGGKTEPNEKIEDTVIRELLEETSIIVTIEKYLGVFYHEKKDKEQHLFLCNYINGEPQLGDSVEMDKMSKDSSNYYKPEWVDLKSVENLIIRPDPISEFFKNYIRKCINS